MASRSALIALLVVVSSVAAASAATITVGGNSGWALNVNYDNWASGKTFMVGDELVFNFAAGQHDVVVVDKSGYDGCSISGAANTIRNSPATVNLTSAGTHYYICGFTGHCGAGMKLAVTVGSGSGSGSPSTPPTPGTGSSPSTPPTSPSAPAPAGTPGSSSVRVTAGPALAVAAAALVKLALF